MFRWLALRSPNTQFSGVGGIGTQNKTVFRWLALRSSNTHFSGGKGGNGTQNITVFLWLALRFPNTQFSGGGWNGKITIWRIDRDRAREWAVYMTLENIYTIGWDDIKTKAGSGGRGNGTQNITVFRWLALRSPNTQFSCGGWNGKITIWRIDRDRAREWAVYITLRYIYNRVGWFYYQGWLVYLR